MTSTSTQQAAVLEKRGQLVLKSVPIPEAVHGTAVIKVLATSISPNAKGVLGENFRMPLSTPVTPSASGIGRVHAVGPDATRLKPGMLVYADLFQRSRDEPDDSILQGYMGGVEILEKVYSCGSYANYAQVSLESVISLDEDHLVGKLGYSIADLVYLGTLAIPAAGLLDIDTRPGDSVIVCPATGYFGGSAVAAALGLGARVIAAGRNEEKLQKMAETFKSTGRFTYVVMTGDQQKDVEALKAASGSSKGADRFVDFSPPVAAGSKHLAACISALRPSGKGVLMGVIFGNVEVPYTTIMRNNLQITGRYMFTRAHIEQVLKMVSTGSLKLGPGEGSGVKVTSFKLGDVDKAVDKAHELAGFGNMVVVEP